MLLTTKTNLATLFVTGQARIWVVKRATSFVSTCYNLSRNNKVATFVFVGDKTCNNSFWSNVAKQVARVFLPQFGLKLGEGGGPQGPSPGSAAA